MIANERCQELQPSNFFAGHLVIVLDDQDKSEWII